MNRKGFSVGLILLLIGTSIIPITAQDTEKPLPTSRGQWFYVGGDGPGNYTRIQDAINDSHDGDTVFVYSGVYYERIVIPKAISIIGESKNTTVMIGTINSDVEGLISLKSDNITISGFTLRFYGDGEGLRIIILDEYPYDFENITISDNIFQTNMSICIWLIGCDFCTITQNIFYLNDSDGIENVRGNNWVITNNLMIGPGVNGGIYLQGVQNCAISNNSIISNSIGLWVVSSDMNNISNNYFFNNFQAIILYEWAQNNLVYSNRIDNPVRLKLYFGELTGISVESGSNYNIIKKNMISHCKIGIFLSDAYDTLVTMNTFMNNIVHARFYNTLRPNHWNQNYWGRPRILPKPIIGIKDISHIYPGFVEFDWHPALAPYDIG